MKILKATDIKHDQATYLIYSNPGQGKTTAIKFIPGKKLVIDIDKSSSVLAGEKDIDILEVNTHDIYDEWTKGVLGWLQKPENIKDYDTIVVDNISELFRSCLADLGRKGNNNRVPSMADYQRIDFVIMGSLRALKTLGKRIVFTAWETSDLWTEANGQQFNRAYPDIRKTILNNFFGLCDVIGRLVVSEDEKGDIKRGFVLQPSESVYAKNRLDDRKGCLVEELVPQDGV